MNSDRSPPTRTRTHLVSMSVLTLILCSLFMLKTSTSIHVDILRVSFSSFLSILTFSSSLQPPSQSSQHHTIHTLQTIHFNTNPNDNPSIKVSIPSDPKPPEQLPTTTLTTIPKVALLFMTPGPMPLENVWKYFLGIDNSQKKMTGNWQNYFSIYVHAAPNHTYPKTSLFYEKHVEDPEIITWGQHSMVEAERKLFKKALEDPSNQIFVLLSDTSIPLLSAPAIYLQLVSENKSRVSACKNDSDPDDWSKRGVVRHQIQMNDVGLTQEYWRKSSQWISLVRKHAQLIIEEEEINKVFSRECWSSPRDQPIVRFCVSDEHYIASVLALKRLENECLCNGVLSHANWDRGGWHPKTYSREEAREEMMMFMRGGNACEKSVEMLNVASADVLNSIVLEVEDLGESDFEEVLKDSMKDIRAPPYCPLFGRKIDGDGAEEWLQVIASVLEKKKNSVVNYDDTVTSEDGD